MAASQGEQKIAPKAQNSRNRDNDPETAGFLPDLLRRGLTLGFSGLFLTEEAVRKAFGDTVPKEWIDFASGQSERTRAEFFDRLSQEIGRALKSIDLGEAAGKMMEGRTLEVTTRIRLLPDLPDLPDVPDGPDLPVPRDEDEVEPRKRRPRKRE